MFETIKATVIAVAGAVRRFTREKEPLAAVSGAAGAITALVAEWQGDLTGDAAWLAVAWAVATWLARRKVTPAAAPSVPRGYRFR